MTQKPRTVKKRMKVMKDKQSQMVVRVLLKKRKAMKESKEKKMLTKFLLLASNLYQLKTPKSKQTCKFYQKKLMQKTSPNTLMIWV